MLRRAVIEQVNVVYDQLSVKAERHDGTEKCQIALGTSDMGHLR
jgi:hypothetical protein